MVMTTFLSFYVFQALKHYFYSISNSTFLLFNSFLSASISLFSTPPQHPNLPTLFNLGQRSINKFNVSKLSRTARLTSNSSKLSMGFQLKKLSMRDSSKSS